MAPRHAADMHCPFRVQAFLQAALLALNLVAAPALHRQTCTGVCAEHRHPATAAGHAAKTAGAAEPAGGSCCHDGPAGAGGNGQAATPEGTESGGCNCLDDCCTLFAHGTTPDIVTDTGPSTVLVSAAPRVQPSLTPRAPHARLLPYPTGPPRGA